MALREVGRAQLLIGRLSLEHEVHRTQDTVAYGDRRLLLAQARDEPVKLGGQVAVLLPRGGLPRFEQGSPQPLAAFARLALLPLAGALVVAWTHPGPRGQTLGAGKAGHVGANLRQP